MSPNLNLIVETTPIEGLLVLKPRVNRDARGFFVESYNRNSFADAGIATTFVQDNHSRSGRGTLRGLHFQTGTGQVKLVRCSLGRVWDVAVDIRPGSPTFGKHHAVELTPEDCAMFYVPAGFAHGFLALSEAAELQYKCSTVYDAAIESGIMWNDAELNVPWPLDRVGGEPLLSERDKTNPGFAAWRKSAGI
jgi:dTDP-4-dehydrorhamnose 3,5-epimerase